MYQTLFRQYLAAYAAQDINTITAMLADDILLRDWKISVRGKPAAISETQKNFAAADTISINILRVYTAENSVAGELKIVVNETETLFVTDIITFDSSGKISSIRAYIGRED